MGFLWIFMMKKKSRISISLSDELINEIEEKRGFIKRLNYIEFLIRRGLKSFK